MGLLDRILKRGKTQSGTNVITHSDFGLFLDGDGYVPLARNPDVIAAVNKVADMVSNMTIHLMENTDKGDIRIKDGLARKIDVNPCDNMTRKTWIFKIVRDLLLFGDGNSVLHVEYDPVNDYILNLRPFAMSEVSFRSDDNGYVVNYRGTDYNPSEIVHFAINPDPDNPFVGTGYRLALRDIVRNLNLATQIKKGFMSGKNVPSLIVKVDSSSGDLATQEGRDLVAKKYLSTSQSGEPWIIPDALMSVEQVKPLSLKDIAINESVEIDKKTVTQTLTRDLLVSNNRYFKLNARSLYSYDITELSSVAQQMTNSMAMRRNEWRDWLGMPPDPDMDELLALENYIPQDKLGDQKKLKGGEEEDEQT